MTPAADQAPAPFITARGLCRTYGSGDAAVTALRDVALSIRPGTVTVLMGPSGSGKSTLLNILGALDTATAGELVIGGVTVTGLSPPGVEAFRRTTVGFLFQDAGLIDRLDVVGNVALPLTYQGVPVRERERRARSWLDRMGLAGRSSHRPDQLSGGERQRVGFARALVTGPSLLICDEPTASLDRENAVMIADLLRTTAREQGVTVIASTHDDRLSARADTILRLAEGRLVQAGEG